MGCGLTGRNSGGDRGDRYNRDGIGREFADPIRIVLLLWKGIAVAVEV